MIELKDMRTKLKNLLEEFNSRLIQAEERIRKLESKSFEIIKSEEKERKKEKEQIKVNRA